MGRIKQRHLEAVDDTRGNLDYLKNQIDLFNDGLISAAELMGDLLLNALLLNLYVREGGIEYLNPLDRGDQNNDD